LSADPTVYFMGEDVGTGGGVFKTNEGLAEEFPGRVINTPICENGFLGVALGMAVTGLRPVVEIIFSDFLPTGADALVNEIPKFRYMTGPGTRQIATMAPAARSSRPRSASAAYSRARSSSGVDGGSSISISTRHSGI